MPLRTFSRVAGERAAQNGAYISYTFRYFAGSLGATSSVPKRKRSGWCSTRAAVALTDSGVATMYLATAALVEHHPDRFLFGTDEVAPSDPAKYLKVYEMYAPFWAALSPGSREKVLKGNYERLFDAARVRVRAWEKANAH